MTAATVDSPVVTGAALRSVNFFNGRLLTGDDLRREQSTLQSRLARLGRTAGEGIAYGLEVQTTIGSSSKERPVVTVDAGLALTRSGIALELAAAVDVSLARDRPAPGGEPGGLFADCQPFAPGTYTAGAGVYLLTIGPAQQGEGRAPVSGLANEPAPCNVAASVEAVRFRLIRLALTPAELADEKHLRNLVAYRCFGNEGLAAVARDPFGGPPPSGGLVEMLRQQTLTDDEVPLALIFWSAVAGIRFVDLWSVRRRVSQQRPAANRWEILSGDREADGERRFLQFQQQIEERRQLPEPGSVRATDEFGLLPSCGFLALPRTSRPGFDLARFFEGLTTRAPIPYVPEDRLTALVRVAFGYPPIDLARHELIWLYLYPPNSEASAAASAQPYVVFVNGAVPYAADALQNLSRWQLGNYSLQQT
jgi:hypothetical protein